jgi:hypothetical protein
VNPLQISLQKTPSFMKKSSIPTNRTP